MGPRWTIEQIRGVAPDDAALMAARKLAVPRPWSRTGCDGVAVWGDCQGSGQRSYQVIVDVADPAYRCSCPSRKFPCKHAIALLLRWAEGTIGEAERPSAATEWLASRRERAQRVSAEQRTTTRGADSADPAAAQRRADQRAARVADGMRELERWLLDQVRDGLSATARAGYAHWDAMAARLVDAQAPGAAAMITKMGSVTARGPDWPSHLLASYSRAWLLARGYAHIDTAEPALAATLRTRVGFTTPREQVLRDAHPIRDRWLVLGSRDETDVDGLTTRRVWLHGAQTGRRAVVLSFAMGRQTLDASLVPGTEVDAELAFYPAAVELRALVGRTHHVAPVGEPSPESIMGMLASYADALARDPWLDGWPVVLGPVTPAMDDGWHVVDDEDIALPLTSGDHWRLLAVSGGRRVVLGGEWSGAGLRPLTAWTAERAVGL